MTDNAAPAAAPAAERKAGLNANQIKFILISVMVIDHLAWGFVDKGSVPWEIMHFFGRLTGPGMAFFLAEGYMHTKSVKKYAIRLFIFALISWPAFEYFEHGHRIPFALLDMPVETTLRVWCLPFTVSGRYPVIYAHFGVVYTLFLGLMGLIIYDYTELPLNVRICGILALYVFSYFGDWGEFDVLFPLVFYIFRHDKRLMWMIFSLVSVMSLDKLFERGAYGIYELGIYLVPLLFSFYNGERGKKSIFSKWVFYLFYPVHLFILGMFRWR